MVRILSLISCRFYSLGIISKTKSMNFEKCYFMLIKGEEKIDITFLLKIKDSVRQFNFSRKTTEPIQSLFARITTNVQKAINKGNKKKTKDLNAEISVNFHNSINECFNDNSTCLDLFSAKGPVYIRIHDQVFEAIFNSPWVVSVNLPQCILAGFPVYPENLTIQYALKEKSVFNWYKGLTTNEKGNAVNDLHVKWDLAGDNFKYVPKTQDIGMKLKLECIPGNDVAVGPAVETISKNVVEAGPGKCPFEERHMFTKTKLLDKRIINVYLASKLEGMYLTLTQKVEGIKSLRCVSYNILADLYCDSDFTRTTLHPYCPPYALHIDYRKLLIIKEIVGYNADIICLQEVDKKIFENYLEPILINEGLKGVFYKKGKLVAEGLSVFFRSDRFDFFGDEYVVLSEALKERSFLKDIWNIVKQKEPLMERVLDRSTVASATYLQSKDNPKELIIVGNTHLYFHPDADHIRLIQGGILIYWLNYLRKTLIEKFPEKRISLILCGDFNSVPSCGIYQLYTSGIAPESLPDWRSKEEELVDNLSLRQDTPLESACGTPAFTNFTAGFADCLDYIFFDKTTMRVEQVVPEPSIEELQANTALPSVVFPSDHIAQIADLRFL